MEKNNAKLNRIAIRWLVAFAALGGFQVAQAGYSTLATPNGFTGAASASARATYAAAATDKAVQNVIRQAGGATATVAGNKVKIDVAYKLASNAPRIAALVVMQHPAVRLAVGAVGVVSWLVSAKLVYDIATGTWRETAEPTSIDGYLYKPGSGAAWYPSPEAACAGGASSISVNGWTYSVLYIDTQNMRCRFAGVGPVSPNGVVAQSEIWFAYTRKTAEGQQCPTGWSMTPAGCVSPALSQPEFVEKLANKPMPSTVPLELPYPSPLPIEQPSPWINPTPGENPQSQPYRVPTGQPSPVPNTNPQQYKQPYVDIVPAPLPDNPWRVDIKPGEVTSTDPNPVTNPNTDPTAEDKPTPEEDKSLCEKHPDILACSKPELDIPDGEIPKSSKTITYQTEDTFGGGSCPGNIYTNINNKSVMVYEWSRTCNVVTTYLRPIILLLGAMGALFILIPGRDS